MPLPLYNFNTGRLNTLTNKMSGDKRYQPLIMSAAGVWQLVPILYNWPGLPQQKDPFSKKFWLTTGTVAWSRYTMTSITFQANPPNNLHTLTSSQTLPTNGGGVSKDRWYAHLNRVREQCTAPESQKHQSQQQLISTHMHCTQMTRHAHMSISHPHLFT